MNATITKLIGGAAWGLVLTALLSSGASAQDAGRDEFMVACASCHGESGRGDGPFAKWLNIEVPGLTGLAAANDGEFPYLDVFMVVDGRTGVRGHGSTMPIWGDRYTASANETSGPYGSEVVTRGRIAVLVDYLESIQD